VVERLLTDAGQKEESASRFRPLFLGSAGMPYAYRKSERIRKNEDFVSTMKGKRLSLDGLSLFYIQNGVGKFRIGISVSKKIANAVKRNRVRRQIRSCVMRVLRDEQRGYDIVLIARQNFLTLKFEQVLATVNKILLRTVLCKQKPEGAAT
jgi:ribonuclease P protein component